MFFRQIFHEESSTLTYLLGDPLWKEAMAIDTVDGTADSVLAILREAGLQLAHVLETHVHADHVSAARELRSRTGARIVMARAAGAGCADLAVGDGDFLVLGDDAIRVLGTPGHTPDSLCFRWRDRVFTGDTLLIGGCGRTDFQGGDAGTLYDSLTSRLLVLPDETLVYPGHDYHGRRVSCIGEEKRLNPRLAVGSRDGFVGLMHQLDLPEPAMIGTAVPANRLCGERETGTTRQA